MFFSIEAQFGNMRKPQDFTVYPARAGSVEIILQCEKRIANVNLLTGKVVLSNGKGGHQGFIKLSPILGAVEVDCPPDVLNQLREWFAPKKPD